ncbi:MAG: membrane dipeptidase [Clostridia bacterium]|nr:membrane dipeptidase [Clostridia bacterium]
MLLFDTHADTLFRLCFPYGENEEMDVTREKLLKGGVSVQVMAMFVGRSDLKSIRIAFDKMLAKKEEMKAAGFRQVDDLKEAKDGETAFMLSVEGCDLLDGHGEMIAEWRKQGVRMAALTWNYENCVATPASKDATTGLKPFGREAVREMQRLKMAVDVSHLNEKGFYELLEMGVIPLASHSCCRKLCNHVRNLTDDQLKALFSAGGYVGVNFYPAFLRRDEKAGISDVCDHVMHMLEMGGEGKIGFGSDFDGIEMKPEGLMGPQDFPKLLDALRRRGLDEKMIRGIAGENLLQYYDRI